MNKIKYKVGLLLVIIVFISCKTPKKSQEAIVIKQIDTDCPVKIKMNKDRNIVFRISFPLEYEYKNKSFIKRKINRVDYYYCKDYGKSYMSGYGGWGSGVFVYQYINDNLLYMGAGSNQKGDFSQRGKLQNFVIYTIHDIDSSFVTQSELKPYLDQMKNQEKDTLSIGTFKEFKEKHPELTKMLLEGDSISFGIFENLDEPYNEKKDVFITLPILY